MGLLNELNAINRTLENNQKQLTKAEIREEDQNRKDFIKRLVIAEFQYSFNKCNTTEILEKIENNLLKNKLINIDFIQKEFNDIYKKKITQKEIDYIDFNYFGWLQKVKREQKALITHNEKIIQNQNKLEEAKQDNLRSQAIQQQQARQEAYNIIITSLKYILLIVCAPFVLLFAFVFGMLKSVK